jgi:hypothetical protein
MLLAEIGITKAFKVGHGTSRNDEGESTLSMNLLHFDFLLSKSAFEELESNAVASLSLDLSRTSASVDILDFEFTNNNTSDGYDVK